MQFFLLKWIFNAIMFKPERTEGLIQAENYIMKSDLIDQLKQNPEVLKALDIPGGKALSVALKRAHSQIAPQMTWSEFSDFYFSFIRNPTAFTDPEQEVPKPQADDWWHKVNIDGKPTTNTEADDICGTDKNLAVLSLEERYNMRD